MSGDNRRLRVAMLAGSLARGGAEKQFVYMARALQSSGADVRIFALSQGECYEQDLSVIGLSPVWVGRHANPLLRAGALAVRIRSWRPHVVQAGHFYVNLHVTIAAATVGALSLGAIRSDGVRDVAGTGAFGKASLRAPHGLLANSYAAQQNATRLGRKADRILVVPNVLDITAFDTASTRSSERRAAGRGFVATAVANLLPQKRLDRFLHALAAARLELPGITGRIAGEGPERAALERLAAELGLLPLGVQFLGERADVPALLADTDALVLTSDHEGFPNVILEAMAAAVPVVTTPAGDAARVVIDGQTGFVVAMDDSATMAACLVALAQDRELRDRMGSRGRARLEESFSHRTLGPTLSAAYSTAASWGPRRVHEVLRCQHPAL